MEDGDENIQIIITTPIYPTEDKEKVEQCLLNILDQPKIERGENNLVVRSSSLKILLPIRDKMRQQRIRDSVRKVLLNNLGPDSIHFDLHKQAAFVGRIHCVTDPDQEDYLGPISIILKDNEENLKQAINWLTAVDFEKN